MKYLLSAQKGVLITDDNVLHARMTRRENDSFSKDITSYCVMSYIVGNVQIMSWIIEYCFKFPDTVSGMALDELGNFIPIGE